MKISFKKYIWQTFRRKISAVLICSMILPSIMHANVKQVYAKELMYNFVEEVEVDETYIDDGMFYIPYSSIEVSEKDYQTKYYFKIKRKGNAENAEKVKLTMTDFSGKYDKDYRIKVVDKAFFSENVKNANVSKSVEEFMNTSDYDEYNFSDAIIDGSVTSDMILSEDEKNNAETTVVSKNSETEKDESEIKETENNETENNEPEIDETDVTENENDETKKIDDIEKSESKNIEETTIDETVGGFTNTDTETTTEEKATEESTTEETTTEEETTKESFTENTTTEEETTKEQTTEETTSEEEKTKESTKEESTTKEIITEETTKEKLTTEETTTTEKVTEESTTENKVTEETTIKETISEETTSKEKTSEEQTTEKSTIEETTTKEKVSEETTTKISESHSKIESSETIKSDTIDKSASQSEIIYGSEDVQFNIEKGEMSLKEGYEFATGLTSDRKQVSLFRNPDYLNLNKNSIEDSAFMQEGVEVVQEELKSAYVVLEFKASQTEKIIELTLLNDNQYKGDREIGFNLSSIDDSKIAGMYSSLTLIIHDDEEIVPSYINFTKTHYEPKDGYVTVEVERTGAMSGLSACMIDSENITAIGGRDFSKVHAKIVFGMGVNKRTIKIPVVSSFVENNPLKFKLKLQVPQGALIGDNATATCSIKKSDKSFEYAYKENNESINNKDSNKNTLFGAPNNSSSNGISIHKLTDGKDYDLDSVILADPINIHNAIQNFKFDNANDDSYLHYINSDQGIEMYLENHSVWGEDCDANWSLYPAEDPNKQFLQYNGFQLEWSCDSTNADITISEAIEGDGTFGWHDLYKKYGEEWDKKTTNFFIDNHTLHWLYFYVARYDGAYRTSPKLRIESLKPILKMYKINLTAADVPELIDDDGHKTTNHKYTKYTVTSLDGAKTDHSAVGFVDKTITVKFDNAINNPFYIKSIYIVKDDGTKTQIASNDDTSATSLSFKMDASFIEAYDWYMNTIDRPGTGGGHIGEFTVQAELGTKPATVKIQKDNRVDVKIWNDEYAPTETTETKDYSFNIGDVLHFTATTNDATYLCDGLDIYHVEPYSSDWDTIRRPDGKDYFPYDAEITEIKVIPEVSENQNTVKVSLPKNMLNNFDTSYGFFVNRTPEDAGDNYEYIIESDASKITGRYFDIKARCNDDTMTPIWYEVNNDKVKYTQNEYYFLASEFAMNNIIYLSCDKADAIPYSLVGNAYYEEVPIGGKTADKYWQAATNIGVMVDETHYGYSDMVGTFSTIPGSGKVGYYNKFKIISDGTDKYQDVVLTNDNLVTRTYTIEYDTGPQTIIVKTYEVHPDDVLISNVQDEHPHVDGVQVYDMASGATFDAVYINDKVTILKAAVTATKSDGTLYTYTYIDENGNEITEDEHVKRIEYVVIDKKDHSVKTVIEATKSNADKTEWEAYFTFERGNPALYMSDDKLYVRIVTDRKVGDGKGSDIDPESSGRSDIPIFNETTYQAISTSYAFIEQSSQDDFPVDIPFSGDTAHPIELPIIGDLSTMINAAGMSFGITSDGDRTRLYIGKKFNGGGNRYDGNGKTVSDTAYDVGLSNFTSAFSDMTEFIKDAGTKRLKTITLGIPTWTFEPIIGVYFEFMLYHDPSAHVTDQFLYTGGGGYFGIVLDLRYTFYFLVVGIPCYVGGEVSISLVAEFGVAVDDGEQIVLNDPSQSFFDDLLSKTHFEFLIRGILTGTAYVGAGVAGTIGVRGGFQLQLLFIYNPFVKKKYPQVEHTVGFSVKGGIRIWVDAVLVSIPIPVYDWPNPYNLGYFDDVKNIFPSGNSSSTDNGSFDDTLKPRPRFGNGSTFTANETSTGNMFGGTYVEDSTRTLIRDVYDSSEPKLVKYANDKALLVYIDDDHNRPDYERTVLRYMIYDDSTGNWSTPQNIWIGNNTADFYPNVCDMGDKILLSFASRLIEIGDDIATKSDLLKRMEIWTTFFDKTTETFSQVERMTTDEYFDYHPQASYDSINDIGLLYYLKNPNVGNLNTSNDILNEVQTEVNGAYLMYMVYADAGDGHGKRWLRDYYYDYELPYDFTPEQKINYINNFGGQRFKNLGINIGTFPNNDPNISDYTTISARIMDVSQITDQIDNIKEFIINNYPTASASHIPDVRTRIEEFNNNNINKIKIFNLLSYVVDNDGDPSTTNDTDLYLKMHCATESETKTIRLTNNYVPDTAPKLIETNDNQVYLFWIQNESMIKMLPLNDLILKSIQDDHINNGVKASDVNIETLDKVLLGDKISAVYPFTDDSNNLYIAWQQNSNGNEISEDNSEMEFKQDLYVAGLISTVDPTTGDVSKSWSNPVRFTNNGKVNDLPTATSFNNRLLLVNNQYNLKSAGDSYDITNSNLQAIKYKPASSLEISSVATDIDSTNADGSVRYKLTISAQNTGLFMADGFTYNGNITYDGQSIAVINNGTSTDKVLPGETTIIGGSSSVPGETPVTTPDIFFTLTRDQQHHLDKVKVNLNIIETNVGDSGISSNRNVFDVCESFDFVVQNDLNGYVPDYKYLKVYQVEDGFDIRGILVNNGNVDSFGNERIYVIDQNDWENPIASSEPINLQVGNQMHFKIHVNNDVVNDTKYGIKDLVLYVKNDKGDKLSPYEIATVNARVPYDIKVNGGVEKLTVEEGGTLTLTTTYEPSGKYINASINYSIKDGTIARTKGNTLYGIRQGTTTLKLTTTEFGGTKEIEVDVVPKSKPSPKPTPPGGGGGGGGGTGGPLMTQAPTITQVPEIKTIKGWVDSSNSTWIYDPLSNKFKLNIKYNGQEVPAMNGFYAIDRIEESIVNDIPVQVKITDTYYFDASGYMLTGWIRTSDNKWYFFENAKNMNEGKMVFGWKLIENEWYYFDTDGVMLVDTLTPDGYKVGADGKYIK